MLVLARRIGQEIWIDGGIKIMVVEIRGDGVVRLGIEAPLELRVDRSEVAIARKAEGGRRKAETKEEACPLPDSESR